jgi:predicted O-linked N-acetylglucosamine transferase (SPINDLY family)
MHPVGRFWLPIARHLEKHFKLIHFAYNPLDDDLIRAELKQLSFQWHSLDVNNDPSPLFAEIKPQFLLDLGGHTADNRPGILNHRFAPVQATYLGFYGPSYGLHCDWWILDNAIAPRVQHSYPGCEPIWALPGPSLCFDPNAHGLPPFEQLRYSEPDHPCLGSFNHTRKLTDSCIERFAAVLSSLDTATLLFRSHSFYDHAVRRWFLQRFIDAGVNPSQLQPIPYAVSGAESLLDYGRIHLHLDSYPVCGTTTTLDSIAMGIPVLTCPNHLYAGAISAALIEQAGFRDWICHDPVDLPAMAHDLFRRYRTAASRRALAAQVRSSPVCDTKAMPQMFASQLKEMLKVASLNNNHQYNNNA